MMLRIVLAAIALAFAVPLGVAQQSHPGNASPAALSAGDQTAVRGLVDGFADAWNRHDMQAMHDLDTEDVEWVNVVGDHWVGKDTVRRGHTAIHKGMDANSSMRVESASIHPITPDVAVVVAKLHFLRTPTDPLYSSHGDTKTRGSFTVVKRNGAWKIAQFQNTIVDPEAEKFDVPSFAERGFSPPKHP